MDAGASLTTGIVVGIVVFIGILIGIFLINVWMTRNRGNAQATANPHAHAVQAHGEHPEALPSRHAELYRDRPYADGNAVIDPERDMLRGQTEFFEVVTAASSESSSRDYVTESNSECENHGSSDPADYHTENGTHPRHEHHRHHVEKGGFILRPAAENAPEENNSTESKEEGKKVYLRKRNSLIVYGRAKYEEKQTSVHIFSSSANNNGNEGIVTPNEVHITSPQCTNSPSKDETKKAKNTGSSEKEV